MTKEERLQGAGEAIAEALERYGVHFVYEGNEDSEALLEVNEEEIRVIN